MNETKIRDNWTEKQIKYIRYLGRNKQDKHGNSYSMEEFAKLIEVNPDTLYEWRKLPGFKQAVFEFILEENLNYLPNLFRAQISSGLKKGKGGDTQAFMALMRQFDLLKSDKMETKTEHSGEVSFTNSVPIQ